MERLRHHGGNEMIAVIIEWMRVVRWSRFGPVGGLAPVIALQTRIRQ